MRSGVLAKNETKLEHFKLMICKKKGSNDLLPIDIAVAPAQSKLATSETSGGEKTNNGDNGRVVIFRL